MRAAIRPLEIPACQATVKEERKIANPEHTGTAHIWT